MWFYGFIMGFLFCLLLMLIAVFLVKRDIKQKRAKMSEELGVDIQEFANALKGKSSSVNEDDIVG